VDNRFGLWCYTLPYFAAPLPLRGSLGVSLWLSLCVSGGARIRLQDTEYSFPAVVVSHNA